MLYQQELGDEERVIKIAQAEIVTRSRKEAQVYLRTAVSDLYYLAGLRELRTLLDADFSTSAISQALVDDFSRLARWKGLYEQLRVIDLEGRERLRINHRNGIAQLVPAEQLQDKSRREYTQAGLRLAPNTFYASRLDLNIEHGAIEQPLRPVLRLIAPLFDSRRSRRGILVLNLTGSVLLEALSNIQSDSRFRFWMLNKEGYWLKGPSPELEWGFMYPNRKDRRVGVLYPQFWSQIQKYGCGTFHGRPGLVTYQRFDPFADVRQLLIDQGFEYVQLNQEDSVAGWVLAAVMPANIYGEQVRPIMLSWLSIGGMLLVAVTGMITLLVYQGTKRHALRIQLAAKQEYEDMLNNLAIGVYRLAEDGRLLKANPTLLGYLSDTSKVDSGLLGTTISRYLVQPQWQEIKSRLDRRGKVQGLEVGYRFAHRGQGWLSITATRTAGEDGQIFYDGTAFDVTAARAAKLALRISEQKLRVVLESAPDAILICDSAGVVVSANLRAQKMFGCSEGMPPDLALQNLFRSESGRIGAGVQDPAYQDEGQDNPREMIATNLHGKEFPVEVAVTTVATQEGNWQMAIVRDISERKQIEQQLLKFSRAVEQSANAIIFTDKDARIEYVNRKFCELNEYTPDEVVGKPMNILRSDNTANQSYMQLWHDLREKGEWRGELENRTKSGRRYWCTQSIFTLHDDAGNLTNYVAVGEDINERKNQEAMIWHLAYYDTLTNLPNRCLFTERLHEAIARTQRHHEWVVIMYMDVDVDGFKHINDSLGHVLGDRLLKLLAERFKSTLRESDVLARLGGDEFAVLSLAHALGLEVIAEGVETEGHREILDTLGCQKMQGYLFARPMRLHDFLNALPNWQESAVASGGLPG